MKLDLSDLTVGTLHLALQHQMLATQNALAELQALVSAASKPVDKQESVSSDAPPVA